MKPPSSSSLVPHFRWLNFLLGGGFEFGNDLLLPRQDLRKEGKRRVVRWLAPAAPASLGQNHQALAVHLDTPGLPWDGVVWVFLWQFKTPEMCDAPHEILCLMFDAWFYLVLMLDLFPWSASYL